MIVAAGDHKLFIRIVYPRADRVGLSEIERSSGHGAQFAGGNKARTDDQKAVRVEHDFVMQHIAVPLAPQIKITVVGEVHGRGLIGRGFASELQLAFVSQRVGDFCFQVAGKSLFAIFAGVGE